MSALPLSLRMPFFDKDKVDLTLQINNLVLPGCPLSGNLLVVVKENVKCAGIVLKVVGEEFCMKEVPSTPMALRQCRSNCATFVHLDRRVNLMQSQNRDSVELKSGTYTFPIHVDIPWNSPPSYSAYVANGAVGLEYIAHVKFDIRMGFDAEITVPFTVLSAVPKSLYEQGRSMLNSSGNQLCHLVPECCSCFSSDNSGYIESTMEYFQNVLVLPSSGSFNTPPPPPPPALPLPVAPGGDGTPMGAVPTSPSSMTVRVRLANRAPTTDIRVIRVKVLQRMEVRSPDAHMWETRVLASSDFVPPVGRVCPNESIQFEVLLTVPQTLATSSVDAPARFPVPTLVTPFCTVSNMLALEFPYVDMEDTVVIQNAVLLSSAVDPSNTVPQDKRYTTAV